MNANSEFKKNLKYFLIFLLTSGIIYFLDNFGNLKFLHSISDFLFVPVKRQVYQSTKKIVNVSKKNNQAKKDLIKITNQLLVAKEKIKELEEENKALRAQLETPLPPQWKYQDGKVIGLSGDLSIDKGKKDGLKEGQIVLAENILVGKIKKTSATQSQVQLPINSQSIIPVVTGKTKARGILKGQFGTKIVLENVLQEEKLEENDSVLTSGGEGFPRGLLIGRIKKIIKKEAEIYQKAEVEPLLNYKELETVFVLVRE